MYILKNNQLILFFCFLLLVSLSVTSRADVNAVEYANGVTNVSEANRDDNNIIKLVDVPLIEFIDVPYQHFKEISVTSKLKHSGEIEFEFELSKESKKDAKMSASNIFIGSFDPDVNDISYGNSIQLQIISNNDCIVNFIVKSISGDHSQRHYLMTSDNEYCEKYFECGNCAKSNIKMTYKYGIINIFVQNTKIAELYYPHFKVQDIRLVASHEPFFVTVYFKKLELSWSDIIRLCSKVLDGKWKWEWEWEYESE